MAYYARNTVRYRWEAWQSRDEASNA